MRKANFVSRDIGLKQINTLPYCQPCIQFVTTTNLPYSDCSKILDGANIPADKSLFSGVVRYSLDDFYDRKREVKKLLQKMKQVYFSKRYFGWPEQPSSGLQMSHLSVAKPDLPGVNYFS